MRIADAHKQHFAGQVKMPQIMGDDKKHTRLAKQPPVAPPVPAEQETEDYVEISANSRQKPKETKNANIDIASMLEQLENARAQGEAMGEELMKRIKCLRIAMHIMSGDKVSNEDHRYLAENEPDMYAKAIMMKMENEKPQEIERISEDEETDDAEESSEATSDTAAPPPELEIPASEPAADAESA